jgi:hypothetical protein
VRVELAAHGLFKLAEPVFARITSRELEANLGHLEDLLEAESATAPETAALSTHR